MRSRAAFSRFRSSSQLPSIAAPSFLFDVIDGGFEAAERLVDLDATEFTVHSPVETTQYATILASRASRALWSSTRDAN